MWIQIGFPRDWSCVFHNLSVGSEIEIGIRKEKLSSKLRIGGGS